MHWWEVAKPYVELSGLLLLAIYTCYTVKMYHANRDSADAATKAATAAAEQTTLLRQQLTGTQAALLDVSPEVTGDVLALHFANRGRVVAPWVKGTLTFSRKSIPDGKLIGAETIPIELYQIRVDDAGNNLPVHTRIPIPNFPPSEAAAAERGTEAFLLDGTLNFDNGFGDSIPIKIQKVYLQIPQKISGWHDLGEIGDESIRRMVK